MIYLRVEVIAAEVEYLFVFDIFFNIIFVVEFNI